MKNLYMRRWVLVLLMVGLGLPGLASYTSNSVSGSFDDPAVWSPSPVPSEKYRTITIVSGAILYKEGSFSWDAKVTIQQNAKFNVGSGFSTGYGGIDIFGELDVNGKLSGSNDGAAFNVKNGAVVTVNGVADKTNITVENGGVLIVNGDFSLSQTLTINQGGSVIINGNFLNGVVKNYGSFVVNGNYTNNQGEGVTVEKNAVLEIFGDLTASANINVKVGGTLIIHGNLSSSNAGIESHGDIIVVGNFSTASSTTVKNTGNLVVGGNFTHLDGDFTVNGNLDDTKVYILNPEAVITAPDWSVVNNPGVVGDLDDFLQKENGSLVDIVNDVIINVVIGYQWKTDVYSSNWKLANNWTGNRMPTSTSNVRIKPCTGVFPEIKKEDGIIEIKDLTIEAGATLTLKPGAKLTVNGKLTIAETGSLVMEHQYGVGGMSSLITNGQVVGQVTTRMTLPQNQWFYLGSSRKNAIFSDFGAGNDGISISAFRSNKYWPIKSTLAGNALRTMEGIATNFLPSESDMDGDGQADSRLIEYKGEINTDVVSRTFDIAGFHLLANPFTSFIDWQDGAGWERANVDHTIWYRTKIGEEMTFVTYNNYVDEMARIAISPYSLGEITPEIVEEHSKIAPMQAVWIKTLSPNASVNLYPESRNHGTAISRLKGSSESGNVIRIEAENEFSRDGAVVFFKDGFTEGKDNGDSEKYFNDSKNIPEVYTIASGKPLAISGLPELSEDYRAIPLSVKNRVEGSVTLKFDLRYFNNEYTAYLEDRYTGTYINLLQNNSYTYTVLKLGEVHDRFVVHLHKITTGIEEVLPEQGQTDGSDFIKIRSLGDKVLVSVSAELIQNGPGVIEVYSIDGRKISEIPAASSRTFLILPQERGIYIVRAIFGRYVKSERVINSTR
jgi:hypothetical protein